MCVILHLKAGSLLDYERFYNAVCNNPHGYGIVVKKDNKITDVIRDCPEGGNDPEEVYKLLEEHKEAERFVHLRWKTDGKISLENTQPFQVLNSKNKQIWFMHNGVLHTYKPPTNYNNMSQEPLAHDVLSEASDSRRFAEIELIPLLKRIRGESGKLADLDDTYVMRVLDKFWPSVSNKGILISNDQTPYYFQMSDWKKLPVNPSDKTGPTFLASNDDYFDDLKRGVVFDQRRAVQEATRKAQEEANRRNNIHKIDTRAPVICSQFNEKYTLSNKIEHIIQDWSMYEPEGFIHLSNLSSTELKSLVNKITEDDISFLLLTLTGFLRDVGTENLKLKDKLQKASKKIEELVVEQKKDVTSIKRKNTGPTKSDKEDFKLIEHEQRIG